MSRKKTASEFAEEVYKRNPSVRVVGEYKDMKTPLLFLCGCGNEWMASPSTVLRGSACSECGIKKRSKNRRLSQEEFIRRVNEVNQTIEIVSNYTRSQDKVICKCRIDDNIWEAKANHLMRGVGCPECARRKLAEQFSKTDSEFCDQLYKTNPNIEVLGKYKNQRTNIKVRCKKDGHTWHSNPSNLLAGCGCPKCKESKGEKLIAKTLDNLGINYKRQHRFYECRDERPLPFDFFLCDMNIAIEFDGRQHFMPVPVFGGEVEHDRTKKRDDIKNQYCDENGILLIRIPYTLANPEEELMKILRSY